jgi:hypothetical protein
MVVVCQYESNPKHREPWQPGRKGSVCPPELLLREAQELLRESSLQGHKRFATRGGRAYCAQEHAEGRWHGYPISWKEVPDFLRRQWTREGRVARRDIKRFWDIE